MASRTYMRSSIARSVYQKMLNDANLRSLDKSKWYACNLDAVPEDVGHLFVLSHSDEETEDFLQACFQKSDWLFLQIYHALARAFLCWFMTRTSINGLLGRGSMFVYSRPQFASLLDLMPVDLMQVDLPRTLLDLGAGDGRVTDVMASTFSDVYVTEISPVMRNVLRSKSYKVLEIDDWWRPEAGPPHFDVISCLNLLDRCDRPLTMLRQMRAKLKPHSGRVVIAVVLPLQQYVESGEDKHSPSEKMFVEGVTFEEQVSSLCLTLFPSHGFQVVKWTRLPYLCEGDLVQSFYWLDDAVFVLEPSSANDPPIEVC